MASIIETLEPEEKSILTNLVDLKAVKEKVRLFSFINKEPFGTLTNLAYLAAAILIALHADGRFTTLVTALTLLFIGSSAFHANGSKQDVIPHWADVGFLYAVAGAIVFHVWGEEIWILIVGMVVVGIFTIYVGEINVVIPVAIATVLAAIGIGVNVTWEATIIPIGLAVTGFIVRFFSDRVKNDRLDDLLHGLWHVFIAAAVYTAWLTIRFAEPYTACSLWLAC